MFILAAFTLMPLSAQTVTPETATEKVLIKTFNGREFIGTIINDDGREVKIMTESVGLVYLRKEEISSIKKAEAENIVNGSYDDGGPFTTRYIFTNNALPIKKGENYAIWNWYGPEVHFAVSPKLNLGLMTTWGITPLVGVAKYTFVEKPSAGFYMSLGTMFGSGTYALQKTFGGLHWLSMTLGNRRNNFTLSGGYSYFRTEREIYVDGTSTLEVLSPFTLVKGPMLSASGVIRIGKKVSLIVDNIMVRASYLQSEDEYTVDYSNPSMPIYKNKMVNKNVTRSILIIMPGLRFQKQEDRSFQASVAIVNLDNGNSFPLPMLSWLRKF